LGTTPRMFNEGMAEYFEEMLIIGEKFTIPYSATNFGKETYPILEFFNQNEWEYLEQGHLYYSSWAWVTFMFSSDKGEENLVSFMKQELEDPCTSYSGDETFEIFIDQDIMMEIEFNEWQQMMQIRAQQDNTH
jgi:hypothetical protein